MPPRSRRHSARERAAKVTMREGRALH
jgi:hypothetical protein